MGRELSTGPVRVLIVDDSAFYRKRLRLLVADHPEIAVVGEARGGKEALAMAARLQPDLVTMDIEMPGMNGMEAIERLMVEQPVPVLVVTGTDAADAANKALALGALEVISKDKLKPEYAGTLVEQMRLLAGVKVISRLRLSRPAPTSEQSEQLAQRRAAEQGIEVVAIASSTGGPIALSTILAGLDAGFPSSIVVAQHIALEFVDSLAERLSRCTELTVKVAEDGERLSPGVVYLAPAAQDMSVRRPRHLVLNTADDSKYYHPCCDTLLESVADVYGPRSLGVVLSGMGADGVKGLCAIRQAGGFTLIQDEASSVVFGMGRAALDAGCSSNALPINRLRDEIRRYVLL
ncbi:MAG: chemotaxis-specific protein-glutamate methyltransferase CheB [Pseudomonadota bacterium]